MTLQPVQIFSALLIAAVTCFALLAPSATAAELKTYSKKATYDDVRFDLTDAIVSKGLKVDANGKVGAMLARTGKDLGTTKKIYKNAEYFAFCSAKLSRQMMEADPGNLGFCPFVMFMYETAAKPGEIVVGYRRPPLNGSAASKPAFEAIDKLLNGIAKAATQ